MIVRGKLVVDGLQVAFKELKGTPMASPSPGYRSATCGSFASIGHHHVPRLLPYAKLVVAGW